MMQLSDLWGFVTNLGDPVFLTSVTVVLVALFFLMRKGYVKYKGSEKHQALLRDFLVLAVPVLAISLLSAEALKILFQVPRPCLPCPGDGCNFWCPFTFSFPSSHATGSAAIAAAVFLLSKKKKYIIAFAFPAIVGASRIVLGVHTIYDVFGGLMLGVAVALLFHRYGGKIHGRKEAPGAARKRAVNRR